ncbi:MAG: Transcriptional regulator, BadM/Rrf2 family [uncultured bacterium]|nr:MAG: Transcriptional regulator, BadM/Rrf2 family [uncultured bacterium]
MFQITRQADYGLLLMTALASHFPQGYISLRDLAEERRLPYRFLSKIILPLRKSGLVDAQEGMSGGYRLARHPEEIHIRTILEALGEDLMLVRCGSGDKACQSFCQCSARGFWHELQVQINEILNHYTLAQLVQKSVPAFKSNVLLNGF